MSAKSDDLEAGLALFDRPFGPGVLIATNKQSEGVDLHRACGIRVRYKLDPSPIRVRQRKGRLRRSNSQVSHPPEQPYRYLCSVLSFAGA